MDNKLKWTGKNISLTLRAVSSMPSVLDSIQEVDIDPEGVFKYILIKVHTKNEPPMEKTIVRGYARCNYHADIMEDVENKELLPRDLDGECIGGGRINHNVKQREIKVYGYSQGYGKADHSIATNLLKKVYKEYQITWSDEGY